MPHRMVILKRGRLADITYPMEHEYQALKRVDGLMQLHGLKRDDVTLSHGRIMLDASKWYVSKP